MTNIEQVKTDALMILNATSLNEQLAKYTSKYFVTHILNSDDLNDIEKLEHEYASLPDNFKPLVTNFSHLQSARSAWIKMDAKKEAAFVKDKINSIRSSDDQKLIKDARMLYNKLSQAEKNEVDNVLVLVRHENNYKEEGDKTIAYNFDSEVIDLLRLYPCDHVRQHLNFSPKDLQYEDVNGMLNCISIHNGVSNVNYMSSYKVALNKLFVLYAQLTTTQKLIVTMLDRFISYILETDCTNYINNSPK